LTVLAAVILIWAVGILAQLFRIQVIRHREYRGKAGARQEISIELAAPRGTIYTRSGRCLAMSVSSQSVYVNPKKLPNISVAAQLLALSLDLDREALEKRLRDAYDDDRG